MKKLILLPFIFIVSFLGACSMPVHGNYCGPNHPKNTLSTADFGDGSDAIDYLDRACYRHDKCYAEKGYTSCACDRQFLGSVLSQTGSEIWETNPSNQFDGQREWAMLKATMFSAYFSATVCKPEDISDFVQSNHLAREFIFEYVSRALNIEEYDRTNRESIPYADKLRRAAKKKSDDNMRALCNNLYNSIAWNARTCSQYWNYDTEYKIDESYCVNGSLQYQANSFCEMFFSYYEYQHIMREACNEPFSEHRFSYRCFNYIDSDEESGSTEDSRLRPQDFFIVPNN